MSIYLLDEMQLNLLKRVKTRLYNESKPLSIDEKRDLANALDSLVYNLDKCGRIDNEYELVHKENKS